jgi:chromosome segregation ATPase
MIRMIAIAALSSTFIAAARAEATTKTRNDWPCRQAKVASVAVAGVWSGPSIEGAAKLAHEDRALADLVARIGARRTSVEEAQALIADFAKTAGENRKERLTALFAGVYERLEAERREVLDGLDRYGAKQKQLAEKLREETQSLRAEQDKTPPDAQKIKAASEALQWDMRVFDERRHALSYVCEAPALIEQRLGALARAIEAEID